MHENATVCVIEDNEQNMYLITYLLKGNGYRVVPAESGSEGLKLAVDTHPDLILLDIQLPGIDGYTVARRLRENVQTREIPIVAVTSYAMPGDREKALESGCDGYIEKPINPETFISEIEPFFRDLPGRG